MTAVWGAAFVIQAVINIAIIEATSTEKAFLINKILPYVFLAVLLSWTFGYGGRAKRRGEALNATERGGPAHGQVSQQVGDAGATDR